MIAAMKPPGDGAKLAGTGKETKPYAKRGDRTYPKARKKKTRKKSEIPTPTQQSRNKDRLRKIE